MLELGPYVGGRLDVLTFAGRSLVDEHDVPELILPPAVPWVTWTNMT
jgi:hypothetical protein